jgi:rhamnosyltransferase subunit B
MTRLLVVTLGSLGDLYPILALCEELQRAGARVTLAAAAGYRHEAAAHQVEFVPLAAEEAEDYLCGTGLVGRGIQFNSAQLTMEAVGRLNFRDLSGLFQQLDAAANGVDAIVAVCHVIAARLVAEFRRLPYVALTFSPLLTDRSGGWGRTPLDALPAPDFWHWELAALRKKVGLPRKLIPYRTPTEDADLVLGLYPEFLAVPAENGQQAATAHRGTAAQAEDGSVIITVHCRTAGREDHATDSQLLSFCDERTVIVTFGSQMDVVAPDYLCAESVAACRKLGLKCLYLSRHVRALPAEEDFLWRPFVPHGTVLPLGGVVVHHGGLGTLCEACRCAKPMVLVPFLFDQPYHAARMQDLIGAPCVAVQEFTRDTLARALDYTLTHASSMKHELSALRTGEDQGSSRAAGLILNFCAAACDA